jgi:molecular chaperone DnaK
MMVRYYKSPAIVEDTPIFTIEYNDDEIDVFCEDLDVCFQKVNAPMLDKSLAQMKEYFAVHGVDSTSQNNFKVLLVGGFSNFYCVENTVRNFFGSRTGLSDKRFDTCFSDNNKSFAIAKGAALIAQKAIHIDHTCTHDIGFMVVRPDENDRWVDADIKIIKKGMKLSEAKTPIFAPNKVQVKVKSGAFRIFMDDGRENGAGRIQAALDQSVGELFPNMDKANNTYQIGFSVDKNLIPTVHIKDASGTVNSVSLNKLLERISLCEVKEEN